MGGVVEGVIELLKQPLGNQALHDAFQLPPFQQVPLCARHGVSRNMFAMGNCTLNDNNIVIFHNNDNNTEI